MNLRVAIFDVLYVIRIHNINPCLMQFLSHRNITYHVPVIELQKYGRKKNIIPNKKSKGGFLDYFFFPKNLSIKQMIHPRKLFLEWDQINTFDLWYDKKTIFFPSSQNFYILISQLFCVLIWREYSWFGIESA